MNRYLEHEKKRKLYINWIIDALLDLEHWERKEGVYGYTTFLDGTDSGYYILSVENFYSAIDKLEEVE